MDRRIELQANDENPLCDFCSDRSCHPVAALLVATRDIRLDPDDGVRRTSLGEWYVCRPCLELIMIHDAAALCERAVRTFTAKNLRALGPARVLFFETVMRADMARIHGAALDQLRDWPSRY